MDRAVFRNDARLDHRLVLIPRRPRSFDRRPVVDGGVGDDAEDDAAGAGGAALRIEGVARFVEEDDGVGVVGGNRFGGGEERLRFGRERSSVPRCIGGEEGERDEEEGRGGDAREA